MTDNNDTAAPFGDECFQGKYAAPVPVDTRPLDDRELASFFDLIEETGLLEVEQEYQETAERRGPVRDVRRALAAIRAVAAAASRGEPIPEDAAETLRGDAFDASKLRRAMRQTWQDDDTGTHTIHYWLDALLRLAATLIERAGKLSEETCPAGKLSEDESAALGNALLFLHDSVVDEGTFENQWVGHHACNDGATQSVTVRRNAALQRGLVALGAPRPQREEGYATHWEIDLPQIGWSLSYEDSKLLWKRLEKEEART